MTKAPGSFKMLVHVYQNTWHHIPEDSTLHIALHDNSNFMQLSKPSWKSDTMNFRVANILYREPVGAMSYFTTWICEERNVQTALDCVQYIFSFPSVKLH